MAVSTMTAPEVEPRQRLTKWLIGAASVVMLPEARGRSLAQIQQMWEARSDRSSYTLEREEVA